MDNFYTKLADLLEGELSSKCLDDEIDRAEVLGAIMKLYVAEVLRKECKPREWE